MAVTIAPNTTDLATTGIPYMHAADVRIVSARVTLDTSYPTGGYTITPQQLGLLSGLCYFADTGMVDDGVASSVAAWWDPATAKLKAYTNAGEVANTTNLSTFVVQITCYGA